MRMCSRTMTRIGRSVAAIQIGHHHCATCLPMGVDNHIFPGMSADEYKSLRTLLAKDANWIATIDILNGIHAQTLKCSRMNRRYEPFGKG